MREIETLKIEILRKDKLVDSLRAKLEHALPSTSKLERKIEDLKK